MLLGMLALAGIVWSPGVRASYPYWEERVSQFEVLRVEKGDVVFVGNSITNRCRWSELFGGKHFKNRGISSDIVSGIGKRSRCFTEGGPSKIFLMVGINDISHHVGADSVVRAIDELVGQIQRESRGSDVYLQSVLPINNDFKRYKNLRGEEETVLRVNAGLEKVAERRGVEWIDLFPGMSDGEGKLRRELTDDGLHLNEAGYRVWRDAISGIVAPGKVYGDEVYPLQEGRTVMVGNSLLKRGEWNELLSGGLVNVLATDGDGDREWLEAVERAAGKHPAVLLLQPTYGYGGDGKLDLAGVCGDSIEARVREGLELVRRVSPGTRVVVQGLIPKNSSFPKFAGFGGVRKEVERGNRGIARVCKELGYEWVDVVGVMSGEDGELRRDYTTDGESLNGAGYRVWSKLIEEKIQRKGLKED